MADPFAIGGIGGGLALGLAGTLLGKGSKVQVPAFAPVDLTQSQGAAISGNIQSAPGAENLAARTTSFNTQQILQMLSAATGGSYAGLISRIGKNLAAGLRGDLSLEDSNMVISDSASKALYGGFGSASGMKRNLVARDLDRTQYEIQKENMDSTMRWLALQDQTFQPAFFSSANMFMPPVQRAGLDVSQKEFSWQTELAKAQAEAAPDPTEAALGGFLGQIGGTAFGLGGLSALGAFNRGSSTPPAEPFTYS